jgi:hypothetical protein
MDTYPYLVPYVVKTNVQQSYSTLTTSALFLEKIYLTEHVFLTPLLHVILIISIVEHFAVSYSEKALGKK